MKVMKLYSLYPIKGIERKKEAEKYYKLYDTQYPIKGIERVIGAFNSTRISTKYPIKGIERKIYFKILIIIFHFGIP